MAKGNNGYRVLSKPKHLWDPTVKAQDRVPKSVDAGPGIEQCNRVYGGPTDYRYGTSNECASSGGPTERGPRTMPSVDDRDSAVNQ